MIGGVAIIGKRIIIHSQLQKQILSQLPNNHMIIEKMGMLAHGSVYWVNMNTYIENTIKHCSTCLEYQNMQLQIPHKITAKLWKVVGADIFMVNNETILCIVDYYSKFLVVKKKEGMLDEDLIWASTVVFAKFGLPKNYFRCQYKFCFRMV